MKFRFRVDTGDVRNVFITCVCSLFDFYVAELTFVDYERLLKPLEGL